MWTFGLNRALELEAIVFAKSARSGVPNHCQIDKRYFSVTRSGFVSFYFHDDVTYFFNQFSDLLTRQEPGPKLLEGSRSLVLSLPDDVVAG